MRNVMALRLSHFRIFLQGYEILYLAVLEFTLRVLAMNELNQDETFTVVY